MSAEKSKPPSDRNAVEKTPRAVTAADIEECAKEAAGRRKLDLGTPEMRSQLAASISKAALRHGTPIGRDILGQTEKAAKALLKRLPEAHAAISYQFEYAEATGLAREDNPHWEGLVQLRTAHNALEWLLARYPNRRRNYTWHNLAVWISVHCPLTNKAAEQPKAVNPDDPLCKYVQQVLVKLGINQTCEGVSEILRRRRGPERQKGKKEIGKRP